MERLELEGKTYWELKTLAGEHFKKGMKTPELIERILQSQNITHVNNRIDVGDAVRFVDNLIGFMINHHYNLIKGGVLTIRVPIFPNPIALGDPGAKRVFTHESFTFFDKRHANWKNLGNKRGYPGFSFSKKSINGAIMTVELTK